MGGREIYQVAEGHKSSFPYSIELEAGEEVTLSDEKKNGWIWGVDKKGAGVWVPEKYLEIKENTGTLLIDYDTTELNVTAGERLTLIKEESGWMWCSNQKGETGWVPSDKVEKLPEA